MYVSIVTVTEGFPNCVLKLDLEVLLLQSKQKIHLSVLTVAIYPLICIGKLKSVVCSSEAAL